MADNIKTKTIPQIKKMCQDLGGKPPSGLVKSGLIEFYNGLKKMKEENILPTEKYTGDDLDFKPVYMKLEEGEDWLTYLKREGWATVSVLDQPEKYRDDFFSWLESLSSNFSREDPSTWNNKNIPPNLHGIFKHFIGHTEFIWNLDFVKNPVHYTQRV